MARGFRKKFRYPGYQKYVKLLEEQFSRDFLLTMDDAKRALHIYGVDVESLTGKTTRRTPEAIGDWTRVDVPATLKDLHPRINLSADYFFVQEIVFLHSILRGYAFRTVENIEDFGEEIQSGSDAKRGQRMHKHV